MPIFEYACESCTHKFEQLVRNGSSEVSCPKCGSGEKLRKLFSVFSSTSSGSNGSDSVGSFDGPGCGRCGDPQGPCGM